MVHMMIQVVLWIAVALVVVLTILGGLARYEHTHPTEFDSRRWR